MSGKSRLSIELSAEEIRTLRSWVNAGTTEQRLVERAWVILLSADGYSVKDIAARCGRSANVCRKWRQRFAAQRLEGLYDAPRPGKPSTIESERKLEVLRLASSQPPDGSSRWSYRKLAAATGVSRDTVQTVLHNAELKPHKVEYWCGRSPDPEFETKQADIVGLYLDPPDNALVLAVDEKSQIQAVDRSQPELPLAPGRPRRQTATYTRHGTTCLLAALAVHDGRVEARCVDRNSHEEFLAFLKHLYRQHPHRQLHVIVDNLATHKHKAVRDWLQRRRRITLHFTPTYASWLNQVEIFFGIFTRDVVKGGVWRSKIELVQQIMRYIKHYNATRANPFRWTYTGEPLVA